MTVKRTLLLSLMTALVSKGAILTISAGGTGATASIQGQVDAFRTALGTLNANVAGSFGSGRREINWDAVPAGFSDPNPLPGNFFNSNSPRGLVMTQDAGSLLVTTSTGLLADSFPFSTTKIFGLTGAGKFLDITFFVPGTATVATTRGFGAIFLDADGGTHSIEAFRANGTSAGVFQVPNATVSSGGFSFLGIYGDAGEQFSRFRLNLGSAGNFLLAGETGGCTAAGNGNNCVAVDDFIYGEPVAVPEPGTWSMLIAGGALLLAGRRPLRSTR